MLMWLDLTRRRVVVVVITATAIIVVVAEVLSAHVVLTVVVVISPVVIVVVVVVSPVALAGEPRRRVIAIQAHLHGRPVARRHVVTLFRYVHELSLASGMV